MDMVGGMVLLRVEAGRLPQSSDHVRRLETGDDVIPATVEDRKEHRRRWMNALVSARLGKSRGAFWNIDSEH